MEKEKKRPRRPTKPAGTPLNYKKYIHISVNGKRYTAHRLIYMYHHGHTPECIDHIDGNGLNNCIENLRAATLTQNQYNSKTRSDNTSGFKGVYFRKPSNKWMAYIKINKKMRYLGLFVNKTDAAQAVIEARVKYHGEYARVS